MVCIMVALTFPAQHSSGQSIKRLPGGVSLLWEADSYTPPLYKGKALYSAGGDVRFIAMPDDHLGTPGDLVYEWSVDGNVFGSDSGQGVQTFTIGGSDLNPTPFVAVRVRETSNGDVLAAAGMELQPTPPSVSLYENDPASGVQFQNTLQGELSLQDDEVILSAHPYFFSTTQKKDVEYEWRLNGNTVGNAPMLTFRKGERAGRSNVSITVTHPDKLLQRATESFVISF